MKTIQRYSHCFVCGDKNDIGLKLDFFEKDGKAWTEFTPTKSFEGYKDILHGGILSTLLDEAMIKSILAKGILTVTSQIEVKFKKPAIIGEKLRIEGEITGKRAMLILTEGRVIREDGSVIAEAKGKFFRVEGSIKKQLAKSLD
ncbi:MAG: PaaI family thioesterase [Candidatus Aminicenantes bacterium]